MSTYIFTVSPDFDPEKIAGWFIFNTWLQRHLNVPIHLEMFSDFPSQQQAIYENRIDLIYANPYDATVLVREKGFEPVARPREKQDEAVILVRADSPFQTVEELTPGICVASTLDPDVNMIGMMMIEPADIPRDQIHRVTKANHLLVAKSLLRGEADVGFVLQEAFDNFSKMLKLQLRPLVSSGIRDISHALLVGPKLRDRKSQLLEQLLNMPDDPKGPGVLEGLGFRGWEAVDAEEMEFMIDLMETLSD